jgi:hypothetical protein
MGWTKEQLNFGVLKILNQSVRIYSNPTSYSVINIGQEITDVRWTGGVLLISLKTGKIRRYVTQTSYTTV